ncbi:MAG TPA: PTS lactose/cellobiose transporter subunit IIA [Erysipelotrichaceae bacterium]|nr:PTS lactose/cellobiose transporter subunit IIA [Erysipelotrichaceae bacterium]
MSEESAQIAMKLIYYAGNAKSLALQAINSAETGNPEEALNKLAESRKELHNAHAIQTNLMTKEMNNENVEKSILMIHAQDHFMAADTTINLADRFVKLYQRLERGA